MPTTSAGFPAQDIAFVKALIGRAALSEEQRGAIAGQLARLETRASSDLLHLAVLGEFNSGKSTFINALLRTPLLTSANQAATAAATMIRYESEFRMTVTFLDGETTVSTGADSAALRRKIVRMGMNLPPGASLEQLLRLVTVDPLVASRVRQAEIGLPAQTLANRLVIIDTPGIGAGVEYAARHEEVTEKVAAETADAAVILIPASNAMTKTLTAFLTGKAQRFLHRSIFVLTKMDQIPETEREPLREFVTGRLAQILDARPAVLQVAAATMLPGRQPPPHLAEAWAYWQSDFEATEEAIRRELVRNRDAIIAEHLAALLQSLLTALGSAVSARRAELDRERAALEKASVADLQAVLGGLLERSRREIEGEIADCKTQTLQQGAAFKTFALQAARQVCARADKATLENAVETGVPYAINQEQAQFDHAGERLLANLRERCGAVRRNFVEQFESNYQSLRALGLKIDVSPLAPVSEALAKGHFKAAQGFLTNSRRRREETARVGCAILSWAPGGMVGAFLGMLAGCSSNGFEGGFYGMLVGGLIGAILAAFLSGAAGAQMAGNMGNLDRRRREVLMRLEPEIDSHASRVIAHRVADFDREGASALSALGQAIHDHSSAYAGAVGQMKQEHQRKTQALAAEEKQTAADSAELRTRSERLEARRRDLRSAALNS